MSATSIRDFISLIGLQRGAVMAAVQADARDRVEQLQDGWVAQQTYETVTRCETELAARCRHTLRNVLNETPNELRIPLLKALRRVRDDHHSWLSLAITSSENGLPPVSESDAARNLSDLLLLLETVASIRQQEQGAAQPLDTPLSVDDEEEAILRALLKARPRRLTQLQLSAQSRIGERTIRSRLPDLLARSLVVHPKGKKQGLTITTTGESVLASLSKTTAE